MKKQSIINFHYLLVLLLFTTGCNNNTNNNGSGTNNGNNDDDLVPEVTITIETNNNTKEISPYIYGANNGSLFSTGAAGDEKAWGEGRMGSNDNRLFTLGRVGGNRWSAYNWETNASHAGIDFNNQNDSFLTPSYRWPWFEWLDPLVDVAGSAVSRRIEHVRDVGGAALITVPIVGYVAADKDGTNVGPYPDSLNRFFTSVAKKNAPLSLTPDTNDDIVYQDEFVNWVNETYPSDPIFYSLDNEPALWADTHQSFHPVGVTYADLVSKNIEYAEAIKDIVADTTIFGYVGYGWYSFITLQDADEDGDDSNGITDYNRYGEFIDYYLTAMANAEQSSRRRLVDVLDIHWYPEALGIAGNGDSRIIQGGNSPEVAQARIQAPRSLWDTTYTEISWITDYLSEPIQLLPRLQDKIDTHYPGTKLAITEYYYGGGDHISGAIAQADVLGILGREGVFAANLWHEGGESYDDDGNLITVHDTFIKAAFDMYRNYDGEWNGFGDTSIDVDNPDPENMSLYASKDSSQSGKMVVIAINKKDEPLVISINLDSGNYERAHMYQLTSEEATPISTGEKNVTNGNTLVYEMPAMSVSTIEFSE